MSDHQEAGVITSLEEIFLSREFGSASREFEGAPVVHVSILRGTDESADTPELEQIFRSATFGQPRAVATPTLRAVPEPTEPVPGRVPGTLPFTPRESTRHRAVAAVSGVAAAALVVAGVASGNGGHPGRPAVSALGQRVNPRPGGGGSSLPPTGTSAAPASTVAQAGGVAASNAGTVAQGGRSGSSPSVLVDVPSGTTAAVGPSPAATAGGSTSTRGGGGTGTTPVPTPTPGAGGALSSLTPVINNAATTVGTTVTSVAGQLGSAAPTLAPVTGALGGVGSAVNGLGPSLALGPTVA